MAIHRVRTGGIAAELEITTESVKCVCGADDVRFDVSVSDGMRWVEQTAHDTVRLNFLEDNGGGSGGSSGNDGNNDADPNPNTNTNPDPDTDGVVGGSGSDDDGGGDSSGSDNLGSGLLIQTAIKSANCLSVMDDIMRYCTPATGRRGSGSGRKGRGRKHNIKGRKDKGMGGISNNVGEAA